MGFPYDQVDDATMREDAKGHAEDSRVIDELETLASELKEGQEPSNVALHEAVVRALTPRN